MKLSFFLSAFGAKLIGTIGFICVYQFYYTHSDSAGFFFHGSTFYELLISGEYKLSREYFFTSDHSALNLKLLDLRPQFDIISNSSVNFFMAKISGLLSVFTFNSYISNSLLISFFCFTGLCSLYHSITKFYNCNTLIIAIAIFFLPSSIFWTSSLMKDTITLGAICWLTSCTIYISKNKFKYGLIPFIALINIYLILNLKPYIFYAYVVAVAVAAFVLIFNTITGKTSKIMYFLFFCFASVALGVFVYYVDEDKIFYMLAGGFIDQIAGFQNWHTYLDSLKSTSAYSLGEYELNPLGLLKKAPLALNVSLFRPYIWEVKNPMMLLVSVEALATFFFTIYAVLKVGLRKLIANIFEDPFYAFLFTYSIFFLTLVGFVSYNFGALARYKIPGFIFFILFLGIALEKNKKQLRSN